MSVIAANPASTWTLREAMAEAERIASKDRSSLYQASQYFADAARYDAFIAMYAVMRLVDDKVDDAGDKAALPEADRRELHAFLDGWERRIRNAYAGDSFDHPLEASLAWAVKTFPVPIELWLSFLDAMRFDVDVPRFENFQTFLEYAEGATVAPTTIYVYLMTAERQADGVYCVSGFDFERCGRELGLFAYIAHILRDVKKDMEACESGLIYLSREDLRAHGMSEELLRDFTRSGVGDERFERLTATLVERARGFQRAGISLAQEVWPTLPADCRFIFQLIVRTYSELLERIAAEPGRALVTDRILSKAEQMQIAEEVAKETGFRLKVVTKTSAARSIGWRDVGWVVGGASVATTAICCWHGEPPLLTLVMAVVLVAFVIRWGTSKDLVGLAVGATLGNLTEILCDVAGVWRHANAQFLGVTPAYILLCYPILGMAIPRLIDAVVGRGRPWKEGQGSVLSWAMLIFGVHVALCAQFAQQNSYLMVASLVCLGAFVWRFRSAHDLATLVVGAAMGLVWELPCTYWGAWSFPNPQLFGLIPLWLPIAYAVFFGAIGRITSAALVRCTESRVMLQTSPAQIEPALNGELS